MTLNMLLRLDPADRQPQSGDRDENRRERNSESDPAVISLPERVLARAPSLSRHSESVVDRLADRIRAKRMPCDPRLHQVLLCLSLPEHRLGHFHPVAAPALEDLVRPPYRLVQDV